MKFTDKGIKGLKPLGKAETYWRDGGGGYGVRVSPKGKKTFVFRYKHDGNSRLITIGVYGKITLAQANEAHSKLASEVEKGGDPWAKKRDDKRQRNLSPTVKQFAETFIEGYCKPNKRTWKEDQRILDENVIPAIGKMKLLEVTRLDVRAIINDVHDNGSPNKKAEGGSPVMANRVLACVRKMFAYAVAEDVLEVNVCVGIPKKAVEKTRDRILSHNEIKLLWEALPDTDIGYAIKFLLATGQRTGETRQMEWSELNGSTWEIPKNKAKNGIAHMVPLPTLAMEIIEAQRLKTGSATYVFSGRPKCRGGQFGHTCIDENAVGHAFRRIIKNFEWERTTPHDLRRTMRSQLSRLRVNPVVAEKVLNHKLPGVMGVYDRHDYLDEKTVALQKWSDCLEGVVYPERPKNNIVKFPEKVAM